MTIGLENPAPRGSIAGGTSIMYSEDDIQNNVLMMSKKGYFEGVFIQLKAYKLIFSQGA